jgi:hypothetical protein
MRSIYILSSIILILSGCKKNDSIPAGLNGTWELEFSFSGWSGTHTYPPGNGNTFTFDGHTYLQKIVTTDTSYEGSGTFKVYTGKPCDNASEETLIEWNNDSNTIQDFSLNDGEFSIGTTACILDGGGSTYRKIK